MNIMLCGSLCGSLNIDINFAKKDELNEDLLRRSNLDPVLLSNACETGKIVLCQFIADPDHEIIRHLFKANGFRYKKEYKYDQDACINALIKKVCGKNMENSYEKRRSNLRKFYKKAHIMPLFNRLDNNYPIETVEHYKKISVSKENTFQQIRRTNSVSPIG